MKKFSLIIIITVTLLWLSGCTLSPRFSQLVQVTNDTPTAVAEAMVATPKPTFTPTPDWTDTPTSTATPLPTDTSTPTPEPTATPEDTPTPEPTDSPPATDTPEATETPEPTDTPKPVSQAPPKPTEPPPPTNTPLPQWDYQLAELFHSPSEANILSIMVAVQGHDGGWIPGIRVVGTDPNGLVTKSEPTADQNTGHTPAGSSVIKSGNTKFEPQPIAVYITGSWKFHLETADGRQVSESFTVNMSEENREWYFFRFTPR
ncbi:hypothetical protein QUF58_04140 [Anaerolineales bacterium HSG24]|nr:hypothetical protein [Anaerolineales bacterium HSG24]